MDINQAANEAARLSKTGDGYAMQTSGVRGSVTYGGFNIVIDGIVYMGTGFDECFDKFREVTE